jgi:hypothetical protein
MGNAASKSTTQLKPKTTSSVDVQKPQEAEINRIFDVILDDLNISEESKKQMKVWDSERKWILVKNHLNNNVIYLLNDCPLPKILLLPSIY